MLRAASLSGIRVLDMTQVLAGPFCTLQLADLGAEVIKVEGMAGASREMGFPMQGSDSAGFLALNRNKKSLSLDLKSDAGRDALRKLAAIADVFVENYRPGVTARLGIDFESLSAINPRLVYASISGFGQTGPLAPRPGYDLLAQALSGVMSVTGHPGAPPVKCGLPIGDLTAGLFGAQGILAALLEREQTGRGQYVDTSLLDSLLALSVWESSELWATGHTPDPLGSAHRASAPYQAVQASDGYITVAVNGPAFWERFCTAIGRPELFADERFATNRHRMANIADLVVEIEKVMSGRSVAEWEAIFLEHDVPHAPILDYAQALNSPQAQQREMVVQLQHPVEGTINALGTPVKMSAATGTAWTSAPLLGADTAALLAEVGYSSSDIDELVELSAINCGTPPANPTKEHNG